MLGRAGEGKRFARATTRWFRKRQCRSARKESFPPDIRAITSCCDGGGGKDEDGNGDVGCEGDILKNWVGIDCMRVENDRSSRVVRKNTESTKEITVYLRVTYPFSSGWEEYA